MNTQTQPAMLRGRVLWIINADGSRSHFSVPSREVGEAVESALNDRAQLQADNARLREALGAVMREFVGDRTALNCQGGHIADQARQALSGGQVGESTTR